MIFMCAIGIAAVLVCIIISQLYIQIAKNITNKNKENGNEDSNQH